MEAKATAKYVRVSPRKAGQICDLVRGKNVDEAGRLVAMDVKVGDRVLFGKYSGQTVKVDGEELLVMREEDIMGVLE